VLHLGEDGKLQWGRDLIVAETGFPQVLSGKGLPTTIASDPGWIAGYALDAGVAVAIKRMIAET
jgi:hypothetical protein